MEKQSVIEPDPGAVRKRYETLLVLYNEQFLAGLDKKYANSINLSKEILHCAVNAYFDDICKYKAYASSQFADRHKQAAFTMSWLTRFKPIQIKDRAKVNTTLLTVNESFAIFAGLIFLNPAVSQSISRSFYDHLVYTLTYRNLSARGLATVLYLMEKAAVNDTKF